MAALILFGGGGDLAMRMLLPSLYFLEHDGLLRARRLERVLSDMGPGSPEALFRQLHAFNNAYDRTLADDDRNRRRHG